VLANRTISEAFAARAVTLGIPEPTPQTARRLPMHVRYRCAIPRRSRACLRYTAGLDSDTDGPTALEPHDNDPVLADPQLRYVSSKREVARRRRHMGVAGMKPSGFVGGRSRSPLGAPRQTPWPTPSSQLSPGFEYGGPRYDSERGRNTQECGHPWDDQRAPTRYHVLSAPLPLTSTIPRGSHTNSSASSAWAPSPIWTWPGVPCDSIRLAVLTVSPQRS